MSTDAICTCSHGLGVLRHADDCPVAIDRRQPVFLHTMAEPKVDKDLQVLAERVNGFVYAGDRLNAVLDTVRELKADPELAARLLALAAPSEPVPDGPRVWAMPELPEDVSAVRDREGDLWKRNGEKRWNVQQPEPFTTLTTGGYTNTELIDFYGPLTEVVEEATP